MVRKGIRIKLRIKTAGLGPPEGPSNRVKKTIISDNPRSNILPGSAPDLNKVYVFII